MANAAAGFDVAENRALTESERFDQAGAGAQSMLLTFVTLAGPAAGPAAGAVGKLAAAEPPPLPGKIPTGGLMTADAPKSGRIHGNSKQSPKTAYLYRLEDEQGNLLKWGVTQDPAKRYSKGYLRGKKVRPIESGPRPDMLRNERGLVETQPGPLNCEPWAGKRLGQSP